MVSHVSSLCACLIVLTALLFAGSAAAQDVSPRCEAALNRAAGDFSQCLLRADAHYVRHGNQAKLENRQLRCHARFHRRTGRALSRYGTDECVSTDQVDAMGDRALSCAEGLATEAGGTPAPSRMYVQTADGGELTETTLTLTGVSLQIGYFTDRPYRDAGRMPMADFVALFSQGGGGSSTAEPPTAEFNCESSGEDVRYVATMTEPVLDEVMATLSYTVALVSPTAGEEPFAAVTCDADAHLFIDWQTGDAPTCTATDSCFRAGFCYQACKDNPGYCISQWPSSCSEDLAYWDGTVSAKRLGQTWLSYCQDHYDSSLCLAVCK